MTSASRSRYLWLSTTRLKSRAKHVSQDDKDQGTKAPKEDQIEGSKDNEPGSASGSSKKMIKFSKQTERSIKTIVEEHNSKVTEKSMATWRRLGLATAKKVVRRGFGAYSTSHRPGVSRVAWGLARLKAFGYLLLNDRPQDSKYKADNDLLPKEHPKSSK